MKFTPTKCLPLLATAALLIGCIAATPAPTTSTAPAPTASVSPATAAAPTTIIIDNFTFSPPMLTIPAGTKITWVNRDDVPHTVTSSHNPKTLNSPVLDTDASYSFTFTAPGTYDYYCTVHPHMIATIIVK